MSKTPLIEFKDVVKSFGDKLVLDGMSFQVGWVHWIVPIVIVGILVVKLLRQKQKIKEILKNPIILPVLFGTVQEVYWRKKDHITRSESVHPQPFCRNMNKGLSRESR